MNNGSTWNKLAQPGLFRLFLAWLVVLHHFCFLALGTWAVYVFFILSGYWIATMWEKKYRFSQHPFLTFIGSRYWRLLPLYLICLALCAGVLMRFSVRGPAVIADISNPVWLARVLVLLASASQHLFLVPAWSLDVEMQFYFLAPLLILCFTNTLRTSARWTALLITTVGFASLMANWFLPGDWLHRYLVFFAAGMAVYYFKWLPSPRMAFGSLAVAGLCVVAVVFHPTWKAIMSLDVMTGHDPHLRSLNNRFSTLLALLVLPWIAYSVRCASGRRDRHLGDLAYSVYLFHYIVFLALESISRLNHMPVIPVRLVGLAVVAFGSLLLYFTVEIPNERFRKAIIKAATARHDNQSAPVTPDSLPNCQPRSTTHLDSVFNKPEK